MDQRHTQPTPDTPPADAAAYWMMRKQSGSMDADERAVFGRWLAQANENATEIEKFERLLGGVDLHAVSLLEAELEHELRTLAEQRAESWRRQFGKIAATFTVASIAVVIVLFARHIASLEPTTYATAIGQSSTVALDDGSVAELNTDTKITVDFDGSKRMVTLEGGEAFFNVEKDKSRPFHVKMENAEVIVTGTSFSVADVNGKSSVHVLTGVVDVAPLKGSVATLLAGDTIAIDEVGAAGLITRYDPSLVLAWRSGKVRFHEEPLGEVIESLNRYFETPIALGDESLAALPVTGEFDIRDRATAVRALALIFNLESKEEPARIILEPAEQP